MGQLEEIKARRAAIADAPWLAVTPRPHVPDEYWVTSASVPRECSVAVMMVEREANFIANAPTDIDFLLAEVERLEKRQLVIDTHPDGDGLRLSIVDADDSRLSKTEK